MLEVKQLPENYRHPQGWEMGGYWALVEDGRVIAVAKNKEDL